MTAAAEEQLRELCVRGEHDEALRLALETYGSEIGGFLAARLLDADRAGDAFALFCEELWRALPGFRGESSFRTWAYVIARRATARLIEERVRRARREVPLSQAPLVERLEAELRSATTRWRQTEVKDRVQALRAELEEDERELLVLRVDRGMSWLEIADVFEGAGGDRKKRAAMLRKRYERAKEHLRTLAVKHGLLQGERA